MEHKLWTKELDSAKDIIEQHQDMIMPSRIFSEGLQQKLLEIPYSEPSL